MNKSSIFILLTLFVMITMFTAACGASKSIPDGVSKMKQILVEAQKGLDAGDAEKFKKEADALEESWSKFEDSVKDKSKDVYNKIEEPLGTIQAGAKAPLDKNVLSKAIQNLNAALTETGNLK